MIKKDKNQILNDVMEQKRKTNSSIKYIGVEGVFYKKERSNSFRTLKKSMVVRMSKNFFLNAKTTLKKVTPAMGFYFAGISDVFKVGGTPSHRSFLGRTALYELNSLKKAKELLSDINYGDWGTSSSVFFVSLVYFIKDVPAKDSFSIIYNIGVKSSGTKLKSKIIDIANSKSMKREIVKNSLDIADPKSIYFVGIQWIEKIDSTNTFDVTETIFRSKKNVLKEVEPAKEIKRKLLGLLENYASL